MTRRLLRTALALALVCAVLVGSLWAFQRRLIYLPDHGPVPAAADAVPGGRDVELTTADGLRLGAWFVPGAAPDAPAVLVYRGYGGNPGSPSEEGLALDARAARAWLVGEAGIPQERLVYLGESLGCAVVTGLALEHPPAGLVLRSPFVDLAAVGSEHYPFLPVRLLLRDRHPVAERVARTEVPTTVVLGTADTIVPPAQSRAVAAAAGRLHALVEVPGAGHNDAVFLDGREFVAAVTDLVSHTLGG